MFTKLESINARPKPFQFYTAADLWADEHTSQKMLEFHLNGAVDISSRNSEFIERSIEWIVDHFGVREDTRIADFGCGPGLYTGPLSERGADMTGIDISPRSIKYAQKTARQKGLNIRYLNQNYLEYQTGDKFDLILMIMCDFCALSPAQRSQMLEKFYNLLYPGGSVLLDVYSLEAFDRREETSVYEKNLLDGFWSANPYYGFLNTFKYKKHKVVLDKYTIVEENHIKTVYNWLQYFNQDSLKKEITDHGFDIQGIHGNVTGALCSPNNLEFAVVARKR